MQSRVYPGKNAPVGLIINPSKSAAPPIIAPGTGPNNIHATVVGKIVNPIFKFSVTCTVVANPSARRSASSIAMATSDFRLPNSFADSLIRIKNPLSLYSSQSQKRTLPTVLCRITAVPCNSYNNRGIPICSSGMRNLHRKITLFVPSTTPRPTDT